MYIILIAEKYGTLCTLYLRNLPRFNIYVHFADSTYSTGSTDTTDSTDSTDTTEKL